MQNLIENALCNINEMEIQAAKEQSALTNEQTSAVLWPTQC